MKTKIAKLFLAGKGVRTWFDDERETPLKISAEQNILYYKELLLALIEINIIVIWE